MYFNFRIKYNQRLRNPHILGIRSDKGQTFILNFEIQLTLASSMPVMEASGLSNTRNAARLAVYEATMIMANPAHTIPSTRALKLLGVPERMKMYTYKVHQRE